MITPLLIMPDGREEDWRLLNSKDILLYPGSYNPLHQGHINIAKEAKEHKQGKDKTVVFQIDLVHPFKGNISEEEALKRATQFEWKAPILITSGQFTYLQKATLLPGVTFILGADALKNLLKPEQYPFIIYRLLTIFYNLQVKFLVADRKTDDVILTVDDFPDIEDFRDIFFRLPIAEDISSTELRNKSYNS